MFTTPPDKDHAFFAVTDKNQRDMWWSVCGPSLLNQQASPDLPLWLPELTDKSFTTHYKPDIEFSSPRLGFRFEQLWQQALHTAKVSIQSNLQINSDNRTLGELDLLIDRPGGRIHVELALKFYLGVADDWIGPNRRDLLSQKLRHTQEHQLALSASPEAKAHIGIAPDESIQAIPIMRGCLFKPAHNTLCAPLPDSINSEHWFGYWSPVGALAETLPDGYWYVMSKQDWISPVLAPFGIPKTELIHYLNIYFAYIDTPLCIAQVEEGAYGWTEQKRWMIVPNQWESDI